MERAIVGYHRDSEGDWVAELACGHDQHVRHRPPFQLREWVVTPEGRAARLGAPLNCPLCDRTELPQRVRRTRVSSDWNEKTMPVGLRRAHRLGEGTWGRIVVHDGRLRFSAATSPVTDLELRAGAMQAIPPEVDHHVQPLGAVRFSIEFFALDRDSRMVGVDTETLEEGGDPACWIALVCPECGTIVDRAGYHRPGCSIGATTS